MPDQFQSKPSLSFWVISSLALIWMLFGVIAWFMDLVMDEASMEQFTADQRHLYEIRPGWIFILYGIAVFSGFAGALALLLRKPWAVAAFIISLVTAIIQFGYVTFIMNALGILGPGSALPFPLVILAIGVFLLLYAQRAVQRGWLLD